jgi:cell division protein FtsB
MRSNATRLAYAVAFLLAATYAIVTLRGPRGVHSLGDKQAQIQELDRRNSELQRDIERERERVQRLANNPTEQDLEIRERLKLVHPGEKVYITGRPAK